MKNNIIKATFLIIVGLSFLVACKDDKETNPNSGNMLSLLSSSDYYTLQQIKDDWDNGSLNGVIFLKKEYSKIYRIYTINGVTDSSNYEGTEFSASAGLFNTSLVGLDVTDFVINAYDMERYSKGKYYNTKSDEFETRFGTSVNRIEIDSNSLFNKIQDSVSLGQSINFLNLTRGDTISKSNGLILNWNGSLNATKAFISVYYTDSFDPKISSDTIVSGVSWFQKNTGSIDLKNFIKSINILGTFNISVTLYEPHYVNLSNNKQILVIGESTETVSFKLTN